jgi:shikimate kinase
MQGNNINNVRYETSRTFRKKEYPKTELMNLKQNRTKIFEELSKYLINTRMQAQKSLCTMFLAFQVQRQFIYDKGAFNILH